MWPAIALMVAGAAIKHHNNQEAYNQQNRYRQALENYERQKSQQAMAATQTYIDQQTPQKRAEELHTLQDTRATSLGDSVNAASSAAQRPVLAGNVSADYGHAQDAAATRIDERTRRAIEQLSKMGAPGEQQLEQGIRFGRAAGKVDATNSSAANVGRGYSMDMGNVRPNANADLVGNIFSIGGAASLAGWPGAAAAAASTAGATSSNAAGDDNQMGGKTYYRQRLPNSYWSAR